MAVPDIGSIDYVKYTNITRCFQIILKAMETSRTRYLLRAVWMVSGM